MKELQTNKFFNMHEIYITLDDNKVYKLNKDDLSKMEEVESIPTQNRDNPIMVIHKEQFDLSKRFLLDIHNPFRIDIDTAQIYHRIGFLSYEELTSYTKLINNPYEQYEKEHQTLHDMYVCSMRYLRSEERQALGETQQEIDKRIVDKIKVLYREYAERINKKCIEATGKSIFE